MVPFLQRERHRRDTSNNHAGHHAGERVTNVTASLLTKRGQCIKRCLFTQLAGASIHSTEHPFKRVTISLVQQRERVCVLSNIMFFSICFAVVSSASLFFKRLWALQDGKPSFHLFCYANHLVNVLL